MRWWLYLDVHFLSLTCCQFSWASLFVAESPRVLIFSSSSLCLGTQLTITLISLFPGPGTTELLFSPSSAHLKSRLSGPRCGSPHDTQHWSLFDWLPATSSPPIGCQPHQTCQLSLLLVEREQDNSGDPRFFVPFKVVLQTTGQHCGWS